MGITGKTRVYGVIGDPIEHSLSPILHNAAFSYLKLDSVFLAFQVKKENVENAMQGMRALDIHGLNVTMPHKSAVIPFLDEVDQTAKTLNAVNTIHNNDGRLCGFSTDGIGALKALEENNADPNGKRVLLLGAGGAARAIAYTLAQKASELVILNRTSRQAEELAKVLKQTLSKRVVSKALTRGNVQESLKDSDILVNATSVGMKPDVNQSLVEAEWLKPDLTVMDIVYNPVETKLIKDAKLAKAKVVNGVEMLIHQGAASFTIWTNQQAPVEVMRQTALKQLQR